MIVATMSENDVSLVARASSRAVRAVVGSFLLMACGTRSPLEPGEPSDVSLTVCGDDGRLEVVCIPSRSRDPEGEGFIRTLRVGLDPTMGEVVGVHFELSEHETREPLAEVDALLDDEEARCLSSDAPPRLEGELDLWSATAEDGHPGLCDVLCRVPRPQVDIRVNVERIGPDGRRFTRNGIVENVSVGCLSGVVGL